MLRRRYRVDLPSHMAECDANYLRLMKLFPKLKEEDLSAFAISVGQHPYHVRFEVLERGPYTTLIELRQQPETVWSMQPHLKVRMYHDARSAEVVEFLGARHFRPTYVYPNRQMHLPDEKAQVNRFLSEFLAMCLSHGIAITEPVSAG